MIVDVVGFVGEDCEDGGREEGEEGREEDEGFEAHCEIGFI